MARPRTIKLGDSEVILKNMSKEQADKIEALISQPSQIVVPAETVTSEIIKSDPIELKGVNLDSEITFHTMHQIGNNQTQHNLPLENTALGIRKNSAGKWELVHVKYNAESKQALVDKVVDLGDNKGLAISEFKIAAVRNGLI